MTHSCDRLRRRACFVVAALWCAALFGCGGATNSADLQSAAGLSKSDAETIRLLDGFDPWYLLNQEGRVVMLRLTDGHLTIPAMALVGKLTALEKLNLDRSDLTDEGLAQLKDLHKLHSISVSTTKITDEGFADLAKLPALKDVWLFTARGTRVTSAGIEKLTAARPLISVH